MLTDRAIAGVIGLFFLVGIGATAYTGYPLYRSLSGVVIASWLLIWSTDNIFDRPPRG